MCAASKRPGSLWPISIWCPIDFGNTVGLLALISSLRDRVARRHPAQYLVLREYRQASGHSF
jgi:hypothetical protein